MPVEKKKTDAVFEGGGVKGIGLVGAVSVIEEAGYEFVHLAGTSAGAIVAALLAAGYNAAELKKIITELDLTKLEDPTFEDHIPVVGPLVSELTKLGLYKGDVFLKKMREWLVAKEKHTFKDLIMPDYANDERYRFKLRVIATDISRREMLVLPQDIEQYGMKPEDLEIALAVRMSMSIPLFFEPVKFNGSDIVDGGLVSNFPVGLFDSQDRPPDWPTFGFKLVLSDDKRSGELAEHVITGPISEIVAMFYTAMDAHDAYHLASEKYVRTIAINTLGIGTTEFNLTPEIKEALYQSGVEAAQQFLDTWDFDEYKTLYRSGKPLPTRHELLLPKAKAGLVP
jgi:NTE family protein